MVISGVSMMQEGFRLRSSLSDIRFEMPVLGHDIQHMQDTIPT